VRAVLADDDRARLLEMLAEAQRLGLVGPGGLDGHIRHALACGGAVVDAWTGGGSGPGANGAGTDGATGRSSEPDGVLDLGSGGGLPGLVLACCWSDVRFSLVDAGKRPAEFLVAAVQRLHLAERVHVLNARAEVLGRAPEHRGRYAVVVARSFGPPAVTAECAAPFLVQGGRLVVSEPPRQRTDGDRWPTAGLSVLGMGPAKPYEDGFRFQVVTQLFDCPARYPRRVGVPGKRPIF
jgi:16S rRNA (guanine527-N7)-methyltransferase